MQVIRLHPPAWKPYGRRVDVTRADTASLNAFVSGEVRALLARRRISGRKAAMMLGWTAPYLSRRLIGEIPWNLTDLEAVAALLDVAPESFFPDDPDADDDPEFRKGWILTPPVAA